MRIGNWELGIGLISFPVASELILPEIRTRQCRFPTINPGRDTALPCPLYHSGAAGIDITSPPVRLHRKGKATN